MWLLSPLISSCVSIPPEVRTYDADPGRIRRAIRASLGSFETVEETGGTMTTGWSPEYREGQQGWILGRGYRFRVRHAVSWTGSEVAVRSTVERKPPGGPRSLRWERVDGRRASEALMDEIGRRLEDSP